jgi:uncharacterized Zn-binding protein involved in type VI secretion
MSFESLQAAVSNTVALTTQAGASAMSQVTSAPAAIAQSVGQGESSSSPPPPGAPPPFNPARGAEAAVGAAMGLISAPLDMMNAAAAGLTAGISAALPAFPAATAGTLYIGIPHGHLHPPSFVPPAAMVLLPSLGPITLGTSVQVLIAGMPAARAGDLGMALTCCGTAPIFTVRTGSSSVFIGGMRAARQFDMCSACIPNPDPSRTMAQAMKAAAAAQGIAMIAVAADGIDAAQGSGAAAEAAAIAAGMGAAQAAADAIAMAMQMMMGTDPGVCSAPGLVSALTAPTVHIGGMPLPNFPDVGMAMFSRLMSKLRGAIARRRNRHHDHEDSHRRQARECAC